MTKLILCTVFSLSILLPVTAQSEESTEPDVWRSDSANSVFEQFSPPFPPEVSDGIADLRRYGDRFEKAIRLIEEEAQKPGWSGTLPCDHALLLESETPST